MTGPNRAIGRESDCRSRACKFDPGPFPYFRGDFSFSSHRLKKGCFSNMRKYVHEVLVNHVVKLAQEKVWLDELTISK